MFRAIKQLAAFLHRWTLGWFTRVKPLKKPNCRQQRLHIESLEDRRVFAAGFAEFLDPNPAPGNQFGASVVPLSTGNVVITSPYDDAGGPDAGAVYLFNGRTGKLISTLTGAQPNDHVGIAGVAVLTNGNFIVRSSEWDNGAIQDAGAATWGSGTSGITGIVTVDNSLVGSNVGDKVPSAIQALKNGNYVVSSSSWDSGSVVDAGAATWGDGTQGIHGEITPDNSLVGSTTGDQVGGVAVLTNGNFVVSSPLWDNGSVVDAGAATWGDGTKGIHGVITPDNSLVGSTAGDQVGGVRALTNGNYVVASPLWDNDDAVDAGASTFVNGGTGTSGYINAANSLVGTMMNDQIGYMVQRFPNGNYLVYSSSWHAGTGSATFANGAVGVTGVVSADNSLVGSTPGDGLGGFPVLLSNGNYVIPWDQWDNGTLENVGAVTFGSGTTGVKGVVSADISLVGSSAFDRVGGLSPVVVLTNGNYVVGSPFWHGSSTSSALGAVTFGDGTVGVRGPVSAANSLVGSTSGDLVGYACALWNGNYVVVSPNWDNGEIADVGAVTLGNGVTGTIGEISAATSLIGTSTNDRIGSLGGSSASASQFSFFGVSATTDGNYRVKSPLWDNNAVQDAGAVTIGNGVTGTTGFVSTSNSFVGSATGDQVGLEVFGPVNGNYLVISPKWDNGETVDIGAVTFVNAQTGLIGTASEANSLIGATPNDQIGLNKGSGSRSLSLSNGNYVISSELWDHGDIEDAGAVTFVSAAFGSHGQIDVSNSLVGTDQNKLSSISSMTRLSTGNYLIVSNSWNNGPLVKAGAVTFGNAITGVKGVIDSSNSAVGESENANLGTVVIDDLNQNFYARFLADGGGRVRVGSQIDGFSRPWHLAIQPQDVNNDGQVVAEDVINIINYINAGHSSDVAPNATLGKPYGFLDVTGDGQVVPEDVIAVINYINAGRPTEGEAATTPITTAASLPTTLPASSATTNLTDSLLLLLASDASSAKKRK